MCWFCILPGAAFTVTAGPSLEPDEQAVLGDTVSADIEIIYDVSSMSEYITAYTDLGSASWDAVIIEDGREMPLGSRSGRYLTVTGFELYNPGSSVTKLQVHLEGVVPDYLAGSGVAEVLSLGHIAGDGSTILDSVSKNITIIDLAEVDAMRTETENDLFRFEEEINAAYRAGTDTSAAEEVAADVRDLIEASREMDIQSAYTALSKAQILLTAEWTTLTDSVTQDYFLDAREMIAAIEPAIAEYENAGGVDEQGILIVLSYRDNAEMLLVLAEEKKTSGDDAGAQQYAEDAYKKADEAMVYLADMYTEAGLTLRGYTPGVTSSRSSLDVTSVPATQTLSLPDFMDSGGEDGFGGIDVGGTITFFQVIIDGFWSFADIIQNVSEAFSGIGN
ncbi:hypothetical protein L0665_10310 [Methanogenium marinum]|uniref:Uncharacterized protein n=1 Tax=Methanogenium marinum TaxID=348610 RepID=A0A9Q4KW67_9EURY|nr:hypothetical protein [Methanogenium marinum]MDE4909000.1 hypothetical protein [Methanogenium marinum]